MEEESGPSDSSIAPLIPLLVSLFALVSVAAAADADISLPLAKGI